MNAENAENGLNQGNGNGNGPFRAATARERNAAGHGTSRTRARVAHGTRNARPDKAGRGTRRQAAALHKRRVASEVSGIRRTRACGLGDYAV
ncbi:unnamed protein product [marine sediment metagenome]|uniref:Uncharacterized protein n=1 Tax=marine sediment metagenome TaxID=412755 RepID=X0Y8V6_9ZZZZ